MALNLDAIGKQVEPVTLEYTWRDVVLYALGVGAGFDELTYVYENNLKVIPSFAVIAGYKLFGALVTASGVNLAGLLHGEHDLILHAPIPPQGDQLRTTARITRMYDKGAGKGALVIAEADTYSSDGRKLFTNVYTLFSRLDGGFGGADAPKETFAFPDRAPDWEQVEHPPPDQPLVYRLSGDTFALHIDPDFAQASGFDKPIMHGLGTYGYACRAVIKQLFPGEPERLVRFKVRFSKALYPGVPIKTQIWKVGDGKAFFRTINAETGDMVLDRGVAEWVSRQEADQRARGVIRFDGQVAIVTGAGGGLGQVYALELAKRGAKVVVNDYGGARDGTGVGSASPADTVVTEIIKAGGEAIANYDTVATAEGGERIVQAALDKYGRVDILINNAGILRDKSLANMTPELWEGVMAVHLDGTYNVTRPAYLAMKERGYGRIVMTTSAAGLYGNFGQTNYSAAKLGIVGLMNTLKLEGEKYNIKVNTVAPLAATRLTQDVLPREFLGKLKPEFIAPLVLYLCSEECPVTGGIYNAGMGYYGRAAITSGAGAWVGTEHEPPTPEAVAARWGEILALESAQVYANANAALVAMLTPPTTTKSQPSDIKPAQTTEQVETVRGVFDRIPQVFQPDRAAGVNVVFQFCISGDDGGDWHVTVKDKACQVAAGIHPKPTTTLKMSAQDFLSYVHGQLPAMKAYTSGKLKIEGDLMKSQLVEKLWKF